MRWSARKFVLVGLAVGLAASGGAALWTEEQRATSARGVPLTVEPTTPETSQDFAALAAEVARLKGEMKNDLTTLRSQLASVDRDQDTADRQLNQIADKMSQASLEGAPSAANDEKAETASLTSEQERERAAAHDRAELTLMEGTLHAETPDPTWASTARLALQTTFQHEALPGIQMLNAECRRTLCRMELSLDGSTAQNSYRNLPNLAPWSAPSFIQIDTETGSAVMYLAREEHSLPQMTE